MDEQIMAECGWVERPVDELADRYGSFYKRLTTIYHVAPDNATHITAALVGAEQMPRFEPMLPEIEMIDEIELELDDEGDADPIGPGDGARPSWRGRPG